MNNRFLILIALIAFSCSIAQQPMVDDIVFTTLVLKDSSLAEACDKYSQAFVDSSDREDFLEDCFSDSTGIAFHSQLDTTIRIYFYGDEDSQTLEMTRMTQECVGSHLEDSTVGIPGTYQFSEVMLFELLRLQKIGIIETNRDSVEIFLDSAIALMKKSRRICSDIEFMSYDESSHEATTLLGTVGCCSLVDSSTAVFKISPTIGNVQIKKISLGKFQINGVPSGTAYALFNLNGQLISKGFVGNGILEIPVERAVLKLGGKWFEL